MESFDPFESDVIVGNNKTVSNNANPLVDDMDDLLGGVPLNGNPPPTTSSTTAAAAGHQQPLLDFDDFDAAPNDPTPPPPVVVAVANAIGVDAKAFSGAGSFEDDDMIEIPQESFTKLPESMMTSIHYDEDEDEVEVETAAPVQAPPAVAPPKGDASEEKMLEAEKAARLAAEKEAAEKEAKLMAEKEMAAKEAAEKAAAEKAAKEAAEKAAAEKAAKEAAEKAAKEEAARLAAEKEAAEKAAKIAAEKEAAEKAAAEEAAKIAAEKEAAEKAARLAAEKEAAEKAAAEEAARIAAEKEAAEKAAAAAAEKAAKLAAEKEAAERAAAEEAAKIAAAEKAAKEAAEKEAKLAASRPPILITEPAEEDNFEEPDSSFDDYVNVPAAPIIRGEIESEKKKTVVTSPTQSPVEHVDLFGFLRHVPPTAIDLIYWRKPIRSAVALTVSLALLISFAYFSVISVVANAALLVLVVAFAYVGFKKTVAAVQKTNEGHPFKELLATPPKELIPGGGDCLTRAAKEIMVRSVAGAMMLRHYLLVVDVVDSLKFGLALYIMTYIGDAVNLLTLVTLGVVLLFSLPKIYEANKSQIDAGVEKVMAQIQAQLPVYKALVFDRVIGIWRKVAVYVPGVGGGAARGTETAKSK